MVSFKEYYVTEMAWKYVPPDQAIEHIRYIIRHDKHSQGVIKFREKIVPFFI